MTTPILPPRLATCDQCGQTTLTAHEPDPAPTPQCPSCAPQAPRTAHEATRLFTAPQTIRGQLGGLA